MTDAFFTPAQHAFDHPEVSDAAAGPSRPRIDSVQQDFEIDDSIERIRAGGYKIIALQFPDELLPYSVQVFRAIQKGIAGTAQVYVLADSTYGSCCPDVLSCLHLPADFLIHYGHACLTPTDALPVHYVFPRQSLDVKAAAESLASTSRSLLDGDISGAIVIWDVAYDWLADAIMENFGNASPVPLSFARITRSATTVNKSSGAEGERLPLRKIEPPGGISIDQCIIWYIGDEGRASTNLQMSYSSRPIFAYSPTSKATIALHPKASRLLQKRLFAIHSAMASDVFGLVVGNVGLASSQALLKRMREELRRARKKSYTLSVGRLNPAKLANFAEIECFVLVGCSEGGVVDSKDFMRPIITPWELLTALKGPEDQWAPSEWTLDLSQVLNKANTTSVDSAAPSSSVDPEFSLVTGSLRTRKAYGAEPEADGESTITSAYRDLTLRNNQAALTVLESAGSAYLASREFQGLDPRFGQDAPAALEQGRIGIARGYGGT